MLPSVLLAIEPAKKNPVPVALWQSLWQSGRQQALPSGRPATRRFPMDEPKPGEFRPPYLSFATFWSFLDTMLAQPLPPKIDRSMMRSKSGSDQVSLTAAMKAFGLIGDNQEV